MNNPDILFYECTQCDETKEVEVSHYVDVQGNVHDFHYFFPIMIKCPHCKGTGEEPKPDPYDNPRLP